MEPAPQQTSPAVPIAIISGFAMIAIAIFFTNQNDPAPAALTTPDDSAAILADDTPRPVDETDYIRGNPNAPILMIEYSDYDCPFCKQYHATMNQIMDEYGITGRVAWVYRQFPIGELHPNAPKLSKAALCVGDIGGNEAFWTFSDLIFEERAIDEPTNVTKLPQYAEQAGVSQAAYVECMNDDRMDAVVLESAKDALGLGAQGTPYTVLLVGNQQAVINGAQPYDVVKGIVENLIQQLDGNFDPATVDVSDVPTTDSGAPLLE